MVAAHVELALLEESFGAAAELPPPFSDRIGSAAERTGGSVVFDIRVDGDFAIQRMAAIEYRELGSVLVLLPKQGDHMRCVAVAEDISFLVAELATVARRPLTEQACFDFRGKASAILSFLRRTEHF
jgi:hypothetical protein